MELYEEDVVRDELYVLGEEMVLRVSEYVNLRSAMMFQIIFKNEKYVKWSMNFIVFSQLIGFKYIIKNPQTKINNF